MLTFSHNGTAGDVFYAIPAMQFAARRYGHKQVKLRMYGDSTCHMDQGRVASIFTLMEIQPCIHSCAWVTEKEGIDLGRFRDRMQGGMNIADVFCQWLGVPFIEREQPWLVVPNARKVARVIFNRCARYHNGAFDWRRIVARYRKDAVFIGLTEEFAAFANSFGQVPFYPTPTYLDVAQVIAGCDLFCGNQSSCAAIAEGLKRPVIQETCPPGRWDDNCVWVRPHRINAVNSSFTLPDLP